MLRGVDIEHSSNGLMLWSSLIDDVIEDHEGRFENYDNSNRLGMTIAFDPSK